MRWRADGLPIRLAQTALVAPLAWLLTSSTLIPVWLALTLGAILLEAAVIRFLSPRLPAAAYEPIGLACFGLSTGLFASISVVLLANGSPVALASAALLLGSSTLSNAIMARGWTLATVISAGFSSLLMLACAPIAVLIFHRRLGVVDQVVFEMAAAANVVFTVMLSRTLHREGETIQRARARWRMLFDESPLPQACFDASRLYEQLQDDQVERPLGETLALKFASMGDLSGLITVTETNAAFQALMGGGPTSARAKFDRFSQSILRSLVRSLNAPDDEDRFSPVEGELERPDGRVMDISIHIRSLSGELRPWSDCIATLVDMTEVKAAGRAQQRAAEAAEAANREKSEFLAITSHEIRTPLNGVLGMAQAMGRGRLSKIQRGRLEVIHSSGDALMKILNNILDLAKIEAGRVKLDMVEFDLGRLLREIGAGYEAVAARKGLELRFDVPAEVVGLYRGDPVRVRQVLYNLISNALKFTEAGWVKLSVRRRGDQVEFTVADTGPGINPGEIDRLFEKFVQADSTATRRHEGVGLGLAISRDLCQLMGGSLVAQSGPGEGSRFIATLPLARLPAPARAPEPPAPEPEPDLDRALRLLVAEDNQVNQMVIKALLAEAGVTPVFAENGADALAAWEGSNWDLILMDVQMPVMDGVSATRAIRDREAELGRRPIPIIALSANAMPGQIETYIAAGMTDFVSKPIDVAQLFRVISAHLDPAGPDHAEPVEPGRLTGSGAAL
jgi:signal transduction histidine kinase/ActR/RegA family two-component response regulator